MQGPTLLEDTALYRTVSITIMSGVDDGSLRKFDSGSDGVSNQDHWRISIGRLPENDLCLRFDTYVSRHHAFLHYREHRWWLEDNKSRNGTFIENALDSLSDQKIRSIIPIEHQQLFRVGRTWLRLQIIE